MSLSAYRWAWSQELTPSQKLALLALAEHANDSGVCWPSLARLASLTGMGKRTVQRAIVDLEALNLLTKETGKGKSARYKLDLTVASGYGQSGHSGQVGMATAASGYGHSGHTGMATVATPVATVATESINKHPVESLKEPGERTEKPRKKSDFEPSVQQEQTSPQHVSEYLGEMLERIEAARVRNKVANET